MKYEFVFDAQISGDIANTLQKLYVKVIEISRCLAQMKHYMEPGSPKVVREKNVCAGAEEGT